MKTVIFFLGLVSVIVAGNDNNSIDLSSVTVCATLNNVYKTFANIWEVYNEFKTTGQLWLPVATSACPVTQIDCNTLSPVCAVTSGNFFKTFPNQCILEAEQKATGTAWNVVFNGICSTNPADGFGAPVSQTEAKNDKNGGNSQPTPLDHIPLTIGETLASPDLSPSAPSYPPISVNSEPALASQQSNQKTSEPVQSCSSDAYKQYNSALESQTAPTYPAPPSIPYNYDKSSLQVQPTSTSSLTNTAEPPAKPVLPPNYGNFMQYAAQTNAGQVPSIAKEYTNQNPAQVSSSNQLPIQEQPKEASYEVPKYHNSPTYPLFSPLPSNYNQNSAQEKPIAIPIDSYSLPAAKAIQPLHTNSLISQSSDKFNHLSGEKKPQNSPLSSNSYDTGLSPVAGRYNLVPKPQSSPGYPNSNLVNNSPIPGYTTLVKNPQSTPTSSTPTQYSVPQQPEKSQSPSYALPSYDAIAQRVSGYFKSVQRPKSSEPIPPLPPMTASYSQDSQQSQPQKAPPSQPSPASPSEFQKPLPSPNYGLSSPDKSNYDQNSLQSQTQPTSSPSRKYNSPQPSVNYAVPSYIPGYYNQAFQQSQPQPQEALMPYSAGVQPSAVSGNYNSNEESQPAPASPTPSAQPSVNYAAPSYASAYNNQASQQPQPQEATLPFSEIVPPSAIPVYCSPVQESQPSSASPTPSNCNQVPAKAQSVEDTLTPSDSPSNDVALPSESQKPLPSPGYGYDQNLVQSQPQQKSPPSRNYNSPQATQPSVNYAAPSYSPEYYNQASQQSQPQEAPISYSAGVQTSAVPGNYNSNQESQNAPASPTPSAQAAQPSVNYAAPSYGSAYNNQASQQSQPQEAKLPFSEIVPPSAVPVYYSPVQEPQPSPASPKPNCNPVPAEAQPGKDTLIASALPSNDIAISSDSQNLLPSSGYGYDRNSQLSHPQQTSTPSKNYNSVQAAQPSVNYAAPSHSPVYYNQASQQSQPQETPMSYSAGVQPSAVPGNYNSNQESQPTPASPTPSAQAAQPSVNYAAPSYGFAYNNQASQQSQPQEAKLPFSEIVPSSAVPVYYSPVQEPEPSPSSPKPNCNPVPAEAQPGKDTLIASALPSNDIAISSDSQNLLPSSGYGYDRNSQLSHPQQTSTASKNYNSVQAAQPSVNYAAPSYGSAYNNQAFQQSQPEESTLPFSKIVPPSAVPVYYSSVQESQPSPTSPTPSNCNQVPAKAQSVEDTLTPSDSSSNDVALPSESKKPLPSPDYGYHQNLVQSPPHQKSPPSRNYNSPQATQPSVNYAAPSYSPGYYNQASQQSQPQEAPKPYSADVQPSAVPGNYNSNQESQPAPVSPTPSNCNQVPLKAQIVEDTLIPNASPSEYQKPLPSPSYIGSSPMKSNYNQNSEQSLPQQPSPSSQNYDLVQAAQPSVNYDAPSFSPAYYDQSNLPTLGPLPSIKNSAPSPIPGNPDKYSAQTQSEPKHLTAYNNAPSLSAEAVKQPRPSPNPTSSNYIPLPIPSNYNSAPKPEPSPTYPAPSPNSLYFDLGSRLAQSSQSSQDAASLPWYGNYNSVQKPEPSQPQPSPIPSGYGGAIPDPSPTYYAASYSLPSADVEELPAINSISQNAAQVSSSSRQGYEGPLSALPPSPTNAAPSVGNSYSSSPSNSYVEQNSDAQYSQQKTKQKYEQNSNSYSPSSEQSSAGSYLPSNTEQPASNSIPCSNAQTYNLHSQSQISSDISVTSDESNNSYANEPESNLLIQNSDTNKPETYDGAGKSSQNTQDEAQTIYNGVVYQGPYYYEPKYKHINFGNFNFLPPQSSPPVPTPFADPVLLPANPSASVPETHHPEYNMNPFELLLKQLQYIAFKNGESSY